MDVSSLGAQIAAARKRGVQTNMAWPDPAPSMAEALAIQRKAFEEFGSASMGWKIGATNVAAQQGFGIDSPFYGPMAKAGLLANGASLEKTPLIGACEPEYAFRLARDYPAKGEDINNDTASSVVECLHIAIEVIGRTIANPDFANGVGVTMDFAGNAAFIAGPQVEDWRSQDLVNTPVESWVDEELVHTGNGQPVMGNPVNSLIWLARRLAEQEMHIKAGEWVSTGTCTPAVPATAGTTYSAKFGDFGEVSVVFV